MLNKIILFVAALAVCCGVTAQSTFTKNGIEYTIKRTNEVHVTGYTSGCPSDVVIPVLITNGADSYFVKEVADGAFKGCTALQKIEIPGNIVRIGSQCFIGCKNLETIAIDKSVVEEGKTAKYYIQDGILYADGYKGIHLGVVPAKKTGSVVIPSNVVKIWKGAFDNSCLTKVIMTPMEESIKEETFKDCKNLKYVIFEKSEDSIIPTIKNDAFSGTTGFKVYVPKELKSTYKAIFSKYVSNDGTPNKVKVKRLRQRHRKL